MRRLVPAAFIAYLRVCLDQDIASLFLVESAEKEKKTLPAQTRKSLEKGLARFLEIYVGGGSPIVDDQFIAAVEPERFPGQTTLFFRGKEHSGGITKDAVFSPRPVSPLL